jgi:hypothetical protein
MSMRLIVSFILIITLGFKCFPQNYTRDFGIRFGKGFFVSYRQFYDEERAVEGFAGFSQNALRLCGFREYFKPLAPIRSQNLRMVYGYGVHAGISYTNRYKIFNQVYYHNWSWSPQFGVDGIIGAEYTASEFPILITAAIQPFFEYSLNNYFSLQPLNFIVVFKYRF